MSKSLPSPMCDRRMVLRAAGLAMSLPWLESLMPKVSAAESSRANRRRRIVWVYAPNGVNPSQWMPTDVQGTLQLPVATAPFAPMLPWLTCVEGLVLDKARANGDGPGDHARANAAFLTARQPLKSDGARIRAPRVVPHPDSAIRAIPVPIRTTCPGRANRRRCPKRRIRAACSSACSLTAILRRALHNERRVWRADAACWTVC